MRTAEKSSALSHATSRLRYMKILTICTLLVAFNVTANGMNILTLTADEQQITLSKKVPYPNGISHDKHGALYVGSVVNGNIVKISSSGEQTIFHSDSDEIFSGTSLRYDPLTDILWVASPNFFGISNTQKSTALKNNRISAIQLSSRQLIKQWLIPDGGFGNDIALDTAGGVYVTDSTKDRVYHLKSVTSEFTHFLNSKLFTAGRIGPAGIAVLPNSDLIIGLYSEGTLVRATIDKEGDNPAFSQLNLQRRLENPDGLYPLPNGRLLVLEVAPISGNGRLSIIDLLARPPYPVTTIVNDLVSPLNLTLRNNELFITESRIRHLLLPDDKSPEPDMFFIKRVNLQALL